MKQKNNKTSIMSGATGGHNVIHNVETRKTDVKVPQTDKAEIPLGLAKASPAFKKIEPKIKAAKKDEEQALKANETGVENISPSPQEEPKLS